MVKHAVPVQTLVSGDEIGNRPFASNLLIVWADDDRRYAGTGGAPLIGTRKEGQDFAPDEAVVSILDFAGFNGALSEQRDRPVLVALLPVHGDLVEHGAQPPVKSIVADQHHGVGQLRGYRTLRCGKLRQPIAREIGLREVHSQIRLRLFSHF